MDRCTIIVIAHPDSSQFQHYLWQIGLSKNSSHVTFFWPYIVPWVLLILSLCLHVQSRKEFLSFQNASSTSPHMMSVVGKSTCSGFKTGLYISYHGGNAVSYINQRSYFLKNGLISGYFDTEYMTVLQTEHILHNFEDQKIANFFNIEQVNFHVTLVICGCLMAIHWFVTLSGCWGWLLRCSNYSISP